MTAGAPRKGMSLVRACRIRQTRPQAGQAGILKILLKYALNNLDDMLHANARLDVVVLATPRSDRRTDPAFHFGLISAGAANKDARGDG